MHSPFGSLSGFNCPIEHFNVHNHDCGYPPNEYGETDGGKTGECEEEQTEEGGGRLVIGNTVLGTSQDECRVRPWPLEAFKDDHLSYPSLPSLTSSPSTIDCFTHCMG